MLKSSTIKSQYSNTAPERYNQQPSSILLLHRISQAINPPNGIRVIDSLTRTITFYNYTLVDLCHIATAYQGTPGKLVLNIKDSTRFIKPTSTPRSQWRSENTYCYSLRLPRSLPQAKAIAIIRQDLIRWLSVLGIIIKPKAGNTYIITQTN